MRLTFQLLSLAILFGVTLALYPTWLYLRDRARRKQQNLFSKWPIRRVRVSEIDPVFAPCKFGPSLDTEVQLIGGIDLLPITGGTSDLEAWILAVLSKRSRLMFEFGTASGRTAYMWARNSPPDARVVTLTLGSGDVAAYRREAGDADQDVRNALDESHFSSYYYSGTPVESKILQRYGDSKTFDESPWAGACDLVFVDGSHALSYVLSDSRKALMLVRPGGLVLWHDYRGPALPGVYEALNQLARGLPLMHIAGTSLVAFRRPAATEESRARPFRSG
ncbi:MAG TPA: class I SAM-dependent methyltransferase [Gemmatimonadaceae bacterium]|nr:class I SAM-dependent methyltransferase [Gemmatimonadaceae bacterium]